MLPEDVLKRRDITPGEKVILAVMNMESFDSGFVAASDGAIAKLSGMSRARVVGARKNLEAAGLIERAGPKVKQIQEYRLLHSDMHGGTVEASCREPVSLRGAPLVCVGCHLKRRGVGRGGRCRECVEELELPARVARAREELGTEATADQLSVRLKNRNLSRKIQRILDRISSQSAQSLSSTA